MAKAKNETKIYSYHIKPPFIVEEKAQKGLTFDFVNLLNKHSTLKYKLVIIPKKRLDELSEKIVLWTNQNWVRNDKDYTWITTYLKDADVIIFNKKLAKSYKDITSLFGNQLVCVRGYFYNGLMDYFDSKKIERVDVNKEYQVIRVINRNRYNYGLISLSAFNYITTKNSEYSSLTYSKKLQDQFLRHIQSSKSNSKINSDLESVVKKPAFIKELKMIFTQYNLK